MVTHTYVITYDLDKPGQNYDSLIKTIKSYITWAHISDSCYCIKTSETASQIIDKLNQFIDSNDKIFVAKVSDEAAWGGLPSDVSKWIKSNF
jgi:CRISPR/Cas system-associated endoribonuclease Cas2